MKRYAAVLIVVSTVILATFGVSSAVGNNRPASVPANATPMANNSASVPASVRAAAARVHTEADFSKASPAVRAYIQAPAWQSYSATVTPAGLTPKVVAP